MKSFKKEKFTTADGSPTLYLPDLNEYYHSHHGAVQEAEHVYINNGLMYHNEKCSPCPSLTVFEVGFGTGLNAFLTAQKAALLQQKVIYICIEAYPLSIQELEKASFSSILSAEEQALFSKIHSATWEKKVNISPCFIIEKRKIALEQFTPDFSFNILYYDAFGSRAQPEMWEDRCFQQLIPHLAKGGVFTTYSAKGSVRRILTDLGLEVELVQGPPGKREMIRAQRPKL